jgi:hypothetical protein
MFQRALESAMTLGNPIRRLQSLDFAVPPKYILFMNKFGGKHEQQAKLLSSRRF